MKKKVLTIMLALSVVVSSMNLPAVSKSVKAQEVNIENLLLESVSANQQSEKTVVPDKQQHMDVDKIAMRSGDFRYRELEDGTIEIFEYVGVAENVVIPAEIDGKSVTSIGEYAFANCSGLRNVNISVGVTNIGDHAFENSSSLTNVNIPEGMTRIGHSAFLGCSSLESLNVPDSVTEIDWYAFEGCSSLRSINLPEHVENGAFWDYIFIDCSSLENLDIPNGVTWILGLTFFGCSSLNSINLPESLEHFCDEGSDYDGASNVFGRCSSLSEINVDETNANYASVEGVLYDKEKTTLIFCPRGKTGEVNIPETVTRIEARAFTDCTNLSSINIPAGITGEDVMYRFDDCSALCEINIHGDNTKYSSIEGIVYNKDKTKLIYCPKGKSGVVTIADSVTNIAYDAFHDCNSLSGMTVPASTVSFQEDGPLPPMAPGTLGVFRLGSKMIEINVDEDNQTYASVDGVLYNKDKTKMIKCPEGKTGEVSILNSVTAINEYAFAGCGNLSEINMPNGVSLIDASLFSTCSNLSEINVDEDNEFYSSVDGVLYNEEKTNIIRCPKEKNGEVTIVESVTEIGESAFSGCSNISGINIPEGVTGIGRTAFLGCSSLSSINIPKGVTEIGEYTFRDCSSLSSINIPEGVVRIEETAFLDCSSLSSMNIPASVKEINDAMFESCEGLCEINVDKSNESYASEDGVLYNKDKTTLIYCPMGKVGEVNIPQSMIEIDGDEFLGCTNLTCINIPAGVTNIDVYPEYEDYLFSSCSSLREINVDENNTTYASENGILYNKQKTSVLYCPKGKAGNINIPKGVTEIGDYAFSGCSSLSSISIPEGVIAIGYDAFSDCSSLSIISIPEGVTEIEDGTFSGCSSLINISIPEGVIEIGYDAFSDCSSLSSISIPEGVTEIEDRVFRNCSNLSSISIPSSITTISAYSFNGCNNLKDIYYLGTESQWDAMDIYRKNRSLFRAAMHYETGMPTTPNTPTTPSTSEQNKPIALSKAVLQDDTLTYTGKTLTPSVIVTDATGKTVAVSNYTVTYSNNKNVGQATVTITGKGNYKGTLTASFNIIPKGTKLSKVSAKKKGFTAKWKKQSKQVTGYQIQYSLKKNFKGAKTVTIKKNKTTSKAVSKLKAGKKYYVRIRTYKTVKINGKSTKLYSDWSKAKTVRVKK